MRTIAWCLSCVACACQVQPATPTVPPSLATASVAARNGAATPDALLQSMSAATLTCIGEQHDDPVHHDLQRALIDHVASAGDVSFVAVGFEMFQRRYQPALDDFSRGRFDAAQLAQASDWERNWGFDFAMYAPLLTSARQHGLRLIALNVPRDLTRAVARGGLEDLPADVLKSLPELDIDDQAHRRFFWDVMGFSGDDPHGPHGTAAQDAATSRERFYLAQVIWDETMAESAAAWLELRERRMVVIAGNGHCHDTAIPARVRRRRPDAKTLSVLLASGDETLPPDAAYDYMVRFPR